MNAPATLFEPRRFLFTADMFDAMFRAGVLPEGRNVELLEGEIVEMNAVHIGHGTVTAELGAALHASLKALRSPLKIMVDPSVRTDDYSVPQPDIVVWDPIASEGFAPGNAVKIAIEVADSTLVQDLGRKRALYARAGIPEYWVADIQGRTVRQHADVDADDYRTIRSVPFGDAVTSLTIHGLTVDTSEL